MLLSTHSADELREQARKLVAQHGDSALTLAEWMADALEEAGHLEEARVWKMIAGTVMAIIDA